MKTSFYFALWLGIYAIIDLLNIPVLYNISFFVAFIIVFLCSKYVGRVFRESIICRRYNETVAICEQIYTKNRDAYLKDRGYDILEEAVTFLYLGITIIALFNLHSDDYFCYVVFILVTIGSFLRLWKNIKAYNYAVERGDDDFVIADKMPQGYGEYWQRRYLYTRASDMFMKYRSRSYQTTSYIASGVAIYLGLILLLYVANIMFSYGETDASSISSLMYGSLAFVYGIKDLIDENRQKRFWEEAMRDTSATFGQEEVVRTSEDGAIKKAFKFLFSFKGRTGRKAFVISTVVYFFVMFLIGGITKSVYDMTATLAIIILCLWIVILLSYIAISCRRCHDIGYSGWFQLIPCWWIVLCFIKDDSKNMYATTYDQEDAKTQFNLELSHTEEESVPQNKEEAVNWYRKAAEQGLAEAQDNLGDCFYKGEGVEQSYEEAVKWWRKAAEQGNANAQYNLGACYSEGEGVPQNKEEAVKWYHKAAEQGYAQAQFSLGECYEKGEGVPQDYNEAVKWFYKAAQQGVAKNREVPEENVEEAEPEE